MNGWVYFYIALTFAITGNIFVKHSLGFERLHYGLIGCACLFISAVLWTFSVKTLPLAAASVVWSGASILILSILSYFLFAESFSPVKIAFMLMVLVGCIGLTLISKA